MASHSHLSEGKYSTEAAPKGHLIITADRGNEGQHGSNSTLLSGLPIKCIDTIEYGYAVNMRL